MSKIGKKKFFSSGFFGTFQKSKSKSETIFEEIFVQGFQNFQKMVLPNQMTEQLAFKVDVKNVKNRPKKVFFKSIFWHLPKIKIRNHI